MTNEELKQRINQLESIKQGIIEQQQATKLKYTALLNAEYLSISDFFWREIYASAINTRGSEILRLHQEIRKLEKQLELNELNELNQFA